MLYKKIPRVHGIHGIHGLPDRFQAIPIRLWHSTQVTAHESDWQFLPFPPLKKGAGGFSDSVSCNSAKDSDLFFSLTP
jgi:hypothetical protein